MEAMNGKTINFFGGFRIKEGLFFGDVFAAQVN